MDDPRKPKLLTTHQINAEMTMTLKQWGLVLWLLVTVGIMIASAVVVRSTVLLLFIYLMSCITIFKIIAKLESRPTKG